MKVLFLTNIPTPYRVDFFNELGKLCELTVLYELRHATDRDEKWKANNSYNFHEIFLKGKKIGADSAICFSVLKYLKDDKYDIIVVGGYSTPTGMIAIEFLRFIKKPFILNSDGGITKNDNKIRYRIKSHFISSATAWLSTGKNTDNYLINYGAQKDKIFKYPFTSIKENEILNETLSYSEKKILRNKLNIKEDKIIVSVGQFIYRKGFDILINSMKYLSNEYGVYIIGGKPTEEYINLKVNNNYTNLHFVEFKSKEELKEYYKMSDLFVLPTREDIWGLVINEAMAYGLPIITTDKCIAGLELIEDKKNGYVVPINNDKKLAETIKKVFKSNCNLEKMGMSSIERIRLYSIEKMANRHFEIFKIILGEKNEKKNNNNYF